MHVIIRNIVSFFAVSLVHTHSALCSTATGEYHNPNHIISAPFARTACTNRWTRRAFTVNNTRTVWCGALRVPLDEDNTGGRATRVADLCSIQATVRCVCMVIVDATMMTMLRVFGNKLTVYEAYLTRSPDASLATSSSFKAPSGQPPRHASRGSCGTIVAMQPLIGNTNNNT